MHSVDVVIVGGGPAGAATALALVGHGLEVAVVERSCYDTVRIGETVGPDIKSLLVELGLWERFLATLHNPSHAVHAVWGSAAVSHQDFICHPYGVGWHLDRRRFDGMLADSAEERGVHMHRGTRVTSVRSTPRGWEIAGKSRDRCLCWQAPYLVDATGRYATVGRKLGLQQSSYDRLLGLVGFLTPDADTVHTKNVLLLEAIEDGWWYSVPLPDGRVVAVCMTDADLLQGADGDGLAFWSRHLQCAPCTQERLRGYRPPTQVLIRPAHTARMTQPTAPGFLAVGDAAMAFDPLSAQGIAKALRSGLHAAQTISSHYRGQPHVFATYSEALQQEFDAYLDLRAAYYRMETRWPEAVFWQRRQRLHLQQIRITLDPMREVSFQEQAATRAAIAHLEKIFPFPHFRQLCNLCTTPAFAHQVISAYKQHYGSTMDDHSIIVAMQLLIERAVIT